MGMVKAAFGVATITAPTLRRNESAYKTISNSLSTLHTAGLNIDWNEYHRDFSDSVRLLDLPSYSFDDKNYWIQYEGDWCLTKGCLPTGTVSLLEDSKPRLSTTTVHTVTSEVVNGDTAIVAIESDLARADLRGVVSGHVVNGAMLCPSSLYGDMAMTVCDYAYKLLRPEADNLGMNVANMEVPKSLIARPDGKSQILKLTATVNATLGRADLVFSSGSDKDRVEHAICQVFFGKREEYLSEWQRSAYLIQSRIDLLKDAERNGKAHKIGRGLAYKLFAALVDYDKKYMGMEEVILNSENFEATSRVVFQTTEKDGNFMCSPYWIDSVAHISGFIVNGSDAVDSRENVYISHGWESFRVAEPFSAERSYRSYVKMQPAEGKVLAGDVFVFDGNKIVAVVGGLKFQCIPRKVLNMFLPPIGAAAASKSTLQRPQPARTTPAKTAKTAQVSMENIGSVNKKLVSVCSQALDILATEVGVGIDELVDNIAFTDLGVDSLMSLAVSGRMREELEIDIHSHEFNDHPTIGAFKLFLSKFEVKETTAGSSKFEAKGATSSSGSISSPSTLDHSIPELDDDSDITTPLDDSSSDERKDNALVDIIRTTIAGEMGVEAHEVTDASDLATLGMDSLMSLSILGSLREKTGLSLPADLLIVNPSIRDIERKLNIETTIKPVPTVTVAKQSQTKIVAPRRQATSILLQGNSKRSSKHLWMVPDGSGSATSYVEISDISLDVAVWGLNSPFMKFPEEYKCGVIGMAEYFITEMKRRQPSGPYLLAGWSAGGVIAFEAVNQLIKSGETVEQLIIIDAPCPDIIEPLPASLHRWFASIGLLGDGDPSKIPSWLLPHFAASVNALSNYSAEKIDPEKSPFVTAIWCEDGVCRAGTDDPRPDPFPYGHAQFLLDDRSDFGPNLWDRYLNGNRFVTRHMPGNHFSMMRGAYAKTLGDIIRAAVMQTQ
jgi:iron transport multicopper oxidase